MGNFGGSAYAVMAIPSKMGDVAEGSSPKQADRLCCVLVHGARAVPPPRLNRALETKHVEVRPTTDIYGALAELCRLSNDERIALPILAIVEPESVPHAADLFEAASVYAPKAVLWVYASSPHEQIREVRESDLERWREGSEKPARAGASEQPAPETRTGSGEVSSGSGLRLSGQEGPSPVEAGDAQPRGDDASTGGQSGAILTDEELEMLLADELPESDPEGDGGGR